METPKTPKTIEELQAHCKSVKCNVVLAECKGVQINVFALSYGGGKVEVKDICDGTIYRVPINKILMI